MTVPKQRSPYVEKVTELIYELTRLTPVLKDRVEEARKKGVSLDPALEACLVAASALKYVIDDLLEKVSREKVDI